MKALILLFLFLSSCALGPTCRTVCLTDEPCKRVCYEDWGDCDDDDE